jgi:hypothetical protein
VYDGGGGDWRKEPMRVVLDATKRVGDEPRWR